MKRRLYPLIAWLALLFVILPFTTTATAEPLEEIRQLVKDHYVDEVSDTVLMRGSGRKITDGLDPHSVYMSAKEFNTFMNEIEQRIVGIGVVLAESNEGIVVTSVILGGPADKGGIVAGDIITHVNGISLHAKPVSAAISLIGGIEGTPVKLSIIHQQEKRDVTIKRAEIHLPTVEAEKLGGNVGYIRLNSFATDSAREMSRVIQAMQDAESFIIDLRDNGGGYIIAAQEVTGFFPNVPNAFQLRERNKEPEVYTAIKQKVNLKGRISLLINQNSASASEMLAVNVKEMGAAKLYGQTTYGKGTMQSMYSFQDGSALKLTTARFYSPKGQAVDALGVKPDVLTDIGKEVERAHYDHLKEKYKTYKELPTLKEVSSDKVFTVNLTTMMDQKTMDASAIELIQLGGQEVSVHVEVVDGQTVKIIPDELLESEQSYLLVIHPQWKDLKGKQVKDGIQLKVTIK